MWENLFQMHVKKYVSFVCLVLSTLLSCSNLAYGEVYLMKFYVIKFVSDLRQLYAFLRVLQFPPPIKLTATI